MDRLVDSVTLALSIGNSAQTCARQQSDATGDHTRLVRDDISKQIARDNHAVQAGRVLHHDHGRTVNELMLDLQIRELLLERLRHDLAPQTTRSQHIGLIQTPNLLVPTPPGQEASQPRDALNLLTGVRLRVPGLAGAVVLLPLAEVDAARELAHDDEVGALADGGLERGVLDEGVRGEEAGAQVAVRAHLLAKLEEALLRADGAGAPFRAADGAEEDGVGGFGGAEGLVGQGGAVVVNGALDGRRVMLVLFV